MIKLINCGKLSVCIALTVFFSATASFGQAATPRALPTTLEGNYAVAQTFAHCSGHFAFAAFISKRNNQPDSASTFGDMARGWKVAGMFFLVESMSLDRQSRTEEVFDNLVENKISVMKAKYEIDPKSSTIEFMTDYKNDCEVWVGTQKKLIELMRRGSAKN